MTPQDCWYKETCSQAPSECSASCIRYAEMLYLVQSSNLPEKKWIPPKLIAGQDLEAFKRLAQIKSSIKDWVSKGNNLYIYSTNFGNGKTSWAIKLLLAYFNQIWPGNCFRRRGIFISVPDFLIKNRELINKSDPYYIQLRQDMLTCDVVVWDDISSIRLTDFGHEMMLNILDARVLGGLSNIFTGNVDEQQMYALVGGRLTSRIWNTSEIIQLVDQDKRGLNINNG